MTASPAVYIVCDDDTFRQHLAQQIRADAEVRSFHSVDDALTFCASSVPDGPIVDACSRPTESLRLQRGLQSRGIADAVVQVVREDGRMVGLQRVEPGSARLAGLSDAASLIDEASASRTRETQTPEIVELRRRVGRMSSREAEVMHRVVNGLMNKQVAAELGLSPKTIEVHRAHVMEKMQAESLAELVRMAVKLEEADARAVPHAVPARAVDALASALPPTDVPPLPRHLRAEVKRDKSVA